MKGRKEDSKAPTSTSVNKAKYYLKVDWWKVKLKKKNRTWRTTPTPAGSARSTCPEMVSSSALFKLLLFVVLLTAAATTLRCLRVATSTTILTASQSSTFSGVGPVEPRLRTAAPRVFKVLLVSSNPRSGSSFVGDVLTSVSSSSFYFFEPLRWLFSPVPKLGGKGKGGKNLRDFQDLQDEPT